MTSAVRLHDTLTRRKQALRTGHPDRVSLYVCGPTVYNYAHIGNARPAVVFDVLARVLRQHYAEVIHVRNFTDVDDKINAAAQAEGVPIGIITDRYIKAFHEDMQALNVLAPTFEPRVTEHIPAIVGLVQKLIDKGHAYIAQDHVLFHVPSYPAYGQLSGRQPEDMLAGARVEVAPYKRSPLDFVLWKPSMGNLPGWDSPWGYGRPGWHIECSAMIGQLIGDTVDIHCGGRDLIFPHHENEIAQGTCAHGELYCRHWAHNSFVTVNGQKMSKSLGNVLLVRDLLEQAPGEAIRLALLSSHYRRPLDWNAQRLQAAKQTLTRYYQSLAKVEQVPVLPRTEIDPEVLEALRNDLNVPGALGRLHVLLKQLDDGDTPARQAHAKSLLLASAGLMGLLQQEPHAALATLCPATPAAVRSYLNDSRLKALLEQREQARRRRDFAQADDLRKELESLGFRVEDSPAGPKLRPAAKEQS
ncbi:cysteine--tRNA ligase [Pseudomonas citronellolis]|uniref:cysteine--tRNA ligase n=1 Tax=Pseudomonas citronellolis TaxID=53408 RepID=UPI002FDAA766